MKKLLCVISLLFCCLGCEKEEELPCLCQGGEINYSLTIIDNEENYPLSENMVIESLRIISPNSFTPNNDGINDVFSVRVGYVFIDTLTSEVMWYGIPYSLFINGNQVLDNWNGGGWSGDGFLNGVYDFEVTVDFNGSIHQKSGLVSIIRDISSISNDFDCYPQGVSNCKFPDMINLYDGFIYETQENIGEF